MLTLNNSGIIEKAQEAVDKTNEAQLKQILQVGWAEAYAAGARTEEELKAGVDEVIEKNDLDVSNYDIVVTTRGVTITKKGTSVEKVAWKQEGLTVTNGTQVLTIGDTVSYDETKGGEITGLTATEWKVLGASDEGDLLIMSTADVGNLELGDPNYEDFSEFQNDWLTGPAQMDEICESYGNGIGATSVRSITVEDVNKITGYDPTGYEDGKLWEYGNEVTYTYNGTTKPAYTATNGLSGTLGTTHSSGFHYYNGEEFVVADLTAGTSGETITTLKSDYYYYYAPDLETIDKTSKAYTMLFGEYGAEDTYYWLASPYVYTSTDCANFGMRGVAGGDVDGYDLWYSDGDCNDYWSTGVRAVVSLSSDIQLAGSSEAGWTY